MFDVTVDRNLYLGGSDIPIIMGISPFKSRFDLLLEKAGYKENEFTGNEYTEFGNVIEPKIRDYINETEKDKFVENKMVDGDLRYHSDGVNKTTVLEIKSTSQIKNDVNDYQLYLVQLLLGMQLNNKKKGKLAVYERPKDFNTEFDKDRLTVYDINIKDYKDLLEEINLAIDQFRIDLEKVKANPFITEEDLQPKEVIELSNQIIELEEHLTIYKRIEKEQKELKNKLKSAMQEHGIKKWTTPNGTKITLVDDGEDKEIEVFNEDNFKKDNEELYKKYLEKKIKKGRSGYVLITTKEE
ncbi:MAG TPA: endonuclease [Gallicola sp.]|nr:endonuclease [Gallicola sp.]